MKVNLITAKKAIPAEIELKPKEIYISFPYFKPLVDQIKVMTGAEWLPELKMWTVQYTKGNIFRLAKLMLKDRYVKRYLCDIANCLPNYNEIGLLRPLWKHQKEMYDFIMTRHRCLIGAEPRTGKTRPTIQAFLDSEFPICWYITTKSASLGLVRELHKWFNATKVNDHYLIGDKKIVCYSYDKFVSITKDLGSPTGIKLPGFLVFDECHKLKSISSQRTEAALSFSNLLEDIYKDSEYVVGLSGTPAPLNVTDWWSQCEVIRSGFIREGSITKFRVRYGTYKPWDASTPAWERFEGWCKEEIALLSKRLEGLVRVYFQKDCMDLPPIQFERVKLEPSKELLRVAKMITQTSVSALEARRRLRQIADGFEYTNEYNESTNKVERSGYTFIGSPKINQLKEDLETYEAIGRVIVYAGFQGSVDIITKTCNEMGWMVLQVDGRGQLLVTPDGEKISNAESVQLALGELDRSTDTHTIEKLCFVAETDAGGTGLELSSSPVNIYYSNSDSGEGRMQSQRRAYSDNMDKERGLTIKDYLLLPTDELILNKLEQKEDLQNLSMGMLVDLYKNI